jgi:GNAT superfamily N-acetyltransferase
MPSSRAASRPGTRPGDLWLRPLQAGDAIQVAEVYRDAVLSQANGLYSPEQVRAWSGHPRSAEGLGPALERGFGLVSCAGAGGSIEAFGLLDPLDRLSLLYCRGRSCRQGRATALLEALQQHARAAGVDWLRTEASQLSRPLLERQGWRVEAEETVFYAGVPFQRWRMRRSLL